MTLYKSNNYFADFEQAKNLIVILLTLNKSKNLVIIFADFEQVNYFADIEQVDFFADIEQIRKSWLLFFNNIVRPPLVTYPSLCSTCVT